MKKRVAVLAIILAAGAAVASSAAPVGTTTKSNMSWYTAAGYGACGTQINAGTGVFVAVSHEWWTTANPNKDPLCKVCVKVTHDGKSFTAPIKDKCPGCTKGRIDLSKPLFRKFADPAVEPLLKGASYTFVKC